MTKTGKNILIIFILFFIFGFGYFIGHKTGKQYGAQQYVKLLWRQGEISISPNVVTEKINEYRDKNNLDPFQETVGLCAYAQFRAEEVMKKYTESWDKEKQSCQSMTNPDEMHKSDLSLEQAQKICINCNFNSQRENIYSSAKPESCSAINNFSTTKCTGKEEFGMVENHTDRVVKGWIFSPSHDETLLSKVKYGCVASSGGVVVLETY